jgi:GNAT superfamily N-acetyltransferase
MPSRNRHIEGFQMDYEVRLARKIDLAVMPEIERAAAQRFQPYLEWLEISADVLEGLTTPLFLLRAQADDRLWVAMVNHKPVGFIVAKFLSGGCFIVELDVHPDYGRLGMGSALVRACCQGARLRGFDQILLTTFRKIPWNIPFYQRLGFEILPAEQWSPEIEAIVSHEARYGFAPQKRAVMRLVLSQVPSGPGKGLGKAAKDVS